jgi:HAD superfamily phosphoserine phosphatase-like hydrolase
MEAVSVDELICRIEQAAATMDRPVLATDADGTLWSGDVGLDVFEALLANRGVREEARPALMAEAEAVGAPASGDATAVASALYEAFKHQALSEERAYEVMAWVFAGHTLQQAGEHAVVVQRQLRLEQRFHPEMREIVSWALGRGIDVWVVSASPQFAVQQGVARLGIPADRVIGAEPAMARGLIAPRMAHRMPYGPGKLEAIARVLGPAQLVAAFGDSAFDVPMLRAAAVSVAVRPKAKLRAAAVQVPGMLELAARA